MNKLFILLSVFCLALGACASPAAVQPPTATLSPPTSPPTDLPAPTPAPQAIAELGTVLECTPGKVEEPRAFEDVLASVAPALAEMDSYTYHTIYRYKAGDAYPQDDLSIEVFGTYSGLFPDAGSVDSFPFASQAYQRSHIIQTDLSTNEQIESILTEEGLWVRQGQEAGWAALHVDQWAETWDLADYFSPQAALMGQNAWAPQYIFTRQEDGTIIGPVMARPETIAGKEVMHYCWTPVGGYASFYNAPHHYTYLENAQVHLWTSEDDTQLVRFALAGKHTAETINDEVVSHDPARDFLFWIELSDINQPLAIEPPAASQVILTVPDSISSPAVNPSAPYNELPLPQDARKVGGTNENQPVRSEPREYWLITDSLFSYFYQYYLTQSMWAVPAERRPAYETDESLMGSMAFYIQEMGQRGWELKGKFVQLGWPAVYLFFERDDVRLPVFLQEGVNESTIITAVLPPADDAVAAIRSGWTFYTNTNSDLPGETVKAIAFDSRGKAWLSNSAGVSAFDGKTWTNYTPLDIDPESGATPPTGGPLVLDAHDRVWLGWRGDLAFLDSKTWKVIPSPYAEELEKTYSNRITALAADAKGTVWLGLGDGSVASFDGKTWSRYAQGDAGLESFHDVKVMAFDPQGRLWMGNEGAGIYVFDGKTWETVRPSITESNTSSWDAADALAIDHQGRVWIANYAGLSVYDGKEWKSYTPENSSLPFAYLKELAVDGSDQFWVGGPYGELAVFDPDGESIAYTPLGANDGSYSMNALAIDPRGRIWVGLDDGLRVFTPP